MQDTWVALAMVMAERTAAAMVMKRILLVEKVDEDGILVKMI